MSLDIKKLIALSGLGGSLIPDTDDAYDIGSAALKWKDLYIGGTAYLDAINLNGTDINSVYLKLDSSNDPLTGELIITPSAGTNAIKANKDITLKAGQKLIFDGA